VQIALNEMMIDDAERADDTDQTAKELRALRRCLHKVPPHGREILDAFYVHNRGASQIGAAIGRSGGAVRMMLLRIRQALNACIRRKLAEEGEAS
jgi:DNA-directed RNA polymerase specialized sigma24 family protein